MARGGRGRDGDQVGDDAGDQALASAVVRGVPGAAETLFDRVFDTLYRRVCARLGGDHHAAQDIVSESLLAGLRGLRGFRGDASLESWFHRIAMRKIADEKRRRLSRVLLCGDDRLESLLSTAQAQLRTHVDAATPLDHLLDDEARELISEALESLPQRYKLVLRWKYVDESSVGQVALRLKVSTKAAERRLSRARAALASALRRRGIRGVAGRREPSA